MHETALAPWDARIRRLQNDSCETRRYLFWVWHVHPTPALSAEASPQSAPIGKLILSSQWHLRVHLQWRRGQSRGKHLVASGFHFSARREVLAQGRQQ